MRQLRVAIIDLVTKGPNRSLYARVMHANLASIMPQIIAYWCEQEGHKVIIECYTGFENIFEEWSDDYDIVFISSFTQSALLAYSLSNYFHARGAVTILGGPHARCYPEDAQKYFDYVLGFTDKELIHDVLNDCARYRPNGVHLSAKQQPNFLPGVRARWKYIEATLRKAPLVKFIPMIASLGCPYTCNFCIDSVIPFQPMELEVIKDDLRFLLKTLKRPRVGWHDPNFGIRFDEQMNAIEEAIPPDSIDFVAESSLSLLSEDHLKRLKKNGFKAMLPGIESWYSLGNKSKTGSTGGLEKVKLISDHINLILEYMPYVQTNFVLGLDCDEGKEPFELTKKFIDLTPVAFPAYSLLSAFGRAAPLNLEYQKDNRVLPFPFHFLNNNHAMNVRPLNYSWHEFYDNLIDLMEHTFSWPAIYKRFKYGKLAIPRYLNFIRAVSSEGFGRIAFFKEIRRRLDTDPQFRPYFEQESTTLPQFYIDRIKQDLGPLWQWLPEGAIYHDCQAYLKSEKSKTKRKKAEAAL